LALPIAAAALVVSTQAGAGSTAPSPTVRAAVLGLKLLVPGRPAVAVGAYAGPPPLRTWDGTFAYPDDGSLVRIETVSTHATLGSGGTSVEAESDLGKLSLFGGEITADQVTARVTATVGSADFGGTALTNLAVAGQPVTAQPNARIPIADWGHAVVAESQQQAGATSERAWATALDLWFDAPHAGLPAGTRILVGYAEALVST